MRTSLFAMAAMIALLATPMDAAAGRYAGHGHWGGHGGGRYWGGNHGSNYYGGAWPYFRLGVIVGTGLGRPWARPYPARYAYPPVPYYAYPPAPPAPTPPHACGSWVWVEPEYAWFWEPCVSDDPGVPPAPPQAPIAPRG